MLDLLTYKFPFFPKLNTVCDNGLSPLMLACVNNDENTVRTLLEFGCDPDLETPPQGSQVRCLFHSLYVY